MDLLKKIKNYEDLALFQHFLQLGIDVNTHTCYKMKFHA